MAIIYSYPTVIPTTTDLILGTDVSTTNKSTKNFTVQSIIDLVAVATGNLQTVLDLGNSAIGGNANITLGTLIAPTGTVSASIFTTGTMTINGGIGTGFTDLTSTRITGIIQDASSIQGAVTGVTQTAGTNNLTLATTAYVDSIVDPSVLQYLGDTTGPFDLNLVADDLRVSGTTGEIEVTAVAVNAGNIGTIVLGFPAAGIDLPDGSDATTQPAANSTALIATTAFVQQENNSQDLDFSGDSGTGSVVLSGAGAQTFAITGTTGQVVTAAANQGLVLSLPATVVRNLEGNVTGILKDGSSIETTVTGVTQTQGNDSTRLATTKYVDAAAGAKTLSYKDTSATVKTMNLTADDLQFTGGSNITSTALAVATNIADIKFGLDNSIVLSGQVKADNFTTTLGAATWATTILAGFTSITSTSFVGALTGNATTATSLAAPGTIQLTAGSGLTQGVASNAITYTSGGNVSLTTSLANTTVTAKTLLNLPGFTSASITAGDTILAALAKLQGQITGIPQGLVYKGLWNALTNSPALASGVGVTGQFYIVSVAGATNLDGITDWQVGDWAIFVEVGATDTWQKLDNSQSITGSGAANKITKWTSPTVLGTGLIEDDGTTVTIGANGNLTVLGDTILGDDAAADTITLNGPATFQSTGIFKVGIGLGGAVYGTAGQVLTSGGGSGVVNTWTTPTVGVVTSITAGTGITIGGTAAVPTVAVDYLGTDNFIAATPGVSSNNPNTGDTMVYSESSSGTASNNVKKLIIGNLPFNNYKWKVGDSTATTNTISDNEVLNFVGTEGINTALFSSASYTNGVSIKINRVGSDNAIAGLTAATAVATDTLWFNDISDSNTIRKATISSIVDLGNETLAQVLVNGNNTGGTKIEVNVNDAGGGGIDLVDDAKIRFSTNGHMQIYGTSSENRIYNNGAPLRITMGSGGSVIIGKTDNSTKIAEFTPDGSVDLYYDGTKKLETGQLGVSITDNLYVSYGSGGNLYLGPQTGSGGSNSEITTNHSLYIDYAKITGTSGNFNIRNKITQQFTIQGSSGRTELNQYGSGTITGTPTYNLEINSLGHIIETPSQTIPGGGTFNGNKDIDAGGVIKVFTLTRATTGCLVFDVFFTADFVSGNGGGPPIAEKWTVVHGSGGTPVYNKIISNDGQFGTLGYDVTFASASSGTAVECSVAKRSGSTYPSLSYTIIVGHSENNALTFTPA